jgi:hypothetical protein
VKPYDLLVFSDGSSAPVHPKQENTHKPVLPVSANQKKMNSLESDDSSYTSDGSSIGTS